MAIDNFSVPSSGTTAMPSGNRHAPRSSHVTIGALRWRALWASPRPSRPPHRQSLTAPRRTSGGGSSTSASKRKSPTGNGAGRGLSGTSRRASPPRVAAANRRTADGSRGGLDDLLERSRMTIERLGLHLASATERWPSSCRPAALPTRLEELAAGVEEIAAGASGRGPAGTGSAAPKLGSMGSAEPSWGEVEGAHAPGRGRRSCGAQADARSS